MQRHGRTRHSWYLLLGAAILMIGALLGREVRAAPPAGPVGQTVPLPTATPTQPPPPTATPQVDDDEDDDEDEADSDREEQNSSDESEALPPPAASTESTPPVSQTSSHLQGLVNVENLNVREGPSRDFPIVGAFAEGDVVEILERTADGDWYLICCLNQAGTGSGWATAQFVVPLGVSRQEANRRLTVPPAAADATVQLTASPALTMTVTQLSPFAIQGKTVDLLYTIQNTGPTDAIDVTWHNDLPLGLFYVNAATRGNLQDAGDAVTVAWDSLPASRVVTVTLTLEIDAGLADGATIDNIASAGAANAERASSGISIGLPPAGLPTFQ